MQDYNITGNISFPVDFNVQPEIEEDALQKGKKLDVDFELYTNELEYE